MDIRAPRNREEYIKIQDKVGAIGYNHSLCYDYSHILEQLPEGARVLDIGCRNGDFVRKMWKKGYDAHGMDISKNALAQCEKYYGKEWMEAHLKLGDIQNGPIPYERPFDFVNFTHTLEHCYNPEQAMPNVINLLKPGGWLYLVVPADLECRGSMDALTESEHAHHAFWPSLGEFINFVSKYAMLKIVKSERLESSSGTDVAEYHLTIRRRCGLGLAEAMRSNGSTMLTVPRLEHLEKAVDEFSHRNDVCFVECGVAKGGALALMAATAHPDATVWGFDSWEAMPPLMEKDQNEERALKYNFRKTDGGYVGHKFAQQSHVEVLIKHVEGCGIMLSNIKLVKGFVQDTLLPVLSDMPPIAVLHLDMDFYEATSFALRALYSKVIDGGIVIIDDYDAYIGCRMAVDEFREQYGIKDPLHRTKEKGIVDRPDGVERWWRKGEHKEERPTRTVTTLRPPRQPRRVSSDFESRIVEARKAIQDTMSGSHNTETQANYWALYGLKDLYKGRKAVIFTCGDSLQRYADQAQWFRDQGYIIICVKSALMTLRELGVGCDFHISNFCNEKPWNYDDTSVQAVPPVSIHCQFNQHYGKRKPSQPYDIVVTHYYNPAHNIHTGIDQNIDFMSFDSMFNQHRLVHYWGDIMNELAIPLCVHLGISDTVVVGWDWKRLGQRDATRQKLDELQRRTSAKLAPFLEHKFGLKLRLLGDHSSLQIPHVSMESLRGGS